MRRIALVAGLLAAAQWFPQVAQARVNPLRVITAQQPRAEVMIVLDTSESMRLADGIAPKVGGVCGAGSTATCCLNGVCEKGESGATGCKDCSLGVDCSGIRAGIDLCGDGACSGGETNASCKADCNLTGYRSPSVTSFKDPWATYGYPPIPKWRLGMTAQVSPGGSAPKCSAATKGLLSSMAVMKRVLRNVLPSLRTSTRLGLIGFGHFNWTCDYCSAEKPYFWYHEAVSTKAPFLAAIPPATINATVAKHSKKVTHLYTEWELRKLGGWDTTKDGPKLSFTSNGVPYRRLSGAGLKYAKGANAGSTIMLDALYKRADDPTDEARYPWALAGRTHVAGGHTWQFVGAYYTHVQRPVLSFDPKTIVKMPRQYRRLSPTYRGAQYRDSAGRYWVHRRYDGHTIEHRTSVSSGKKAITFETLASLGPKGILFEPFDTSTAQTAQDSKIGTLLARFQSAENGGLYGAGSTPLGEAIDLARAQFLARQNGTGAYAGKKDPLGACRKRFILMLTDGYHNGVRDPFDAAKDLYNAFPSNPIRVIPVSYQGSFIKNLDRVADVSDDGDATNNSARAFYAANEKQMTKLLQEVVFSVLKGDYTTAAPSVATARDSVVAGNLSLVASTEFPGWRGNLRAYDLTKKKTESGYLKWSAGKDLATRKWGTRAIFSGAPGVDGGKAVRIVGTGGAINTTALAALWQGTPPTPAKLEAFGEWLAGKGRPWRLGAIFRGVPATVGAPPGYREVGNGHAAYEAKYALRQRLVYIGSNGGVLHAFDADTGKEAYAYVPAHLLADIYTMWIDGGQAPDPRKFKWLLAGSVRVEDVPHACTGGNCEWMTQLVVTAGPGSDNFVALDITNPSQCNDPPKCSAYTLNPSPFRVVSASATFSPSLDTFFGETWSVPSMFYRMVGPAGSQVLTAQAGAASGYDLGGAGEGSYYNYFPFVKPKWDSSAHLEQSMADTGGLSRVKPYAVIADTASAVRDNRHVIASYQADMLGRIMRFSGGDATKSKRVFDLGVNHPIYHAPAILHRDGDKVTVAAASGAYEEEDPYIAGPTSFVSRLFLGTETSGVADASNDVVNCAVSTVCGCSDIDAKALPGPCNAPSSRALPIARPVLVTNKSNASATEAFYLYYDRPAAAACSAGQVTLGDTWLVRIASQGTTQTLIDSKKYANTLGTGLAIVGGGTDAVFAKSGLGAAQAAVEKVTPGTLNATTGNALLEGWREVR